MLVQIAAALHRFCGLHFERSAEITQQPKPDTFRQTPFGHLSQPAINNVVHVNRNNKKVSFCILIILDLDGNDSVKYLIGLWGSLL